jgi:hypothetical protein
MRMLVNTLTLLATIGAGLTFAEGVGRFFSYLAGTDYGVSVYMLMLFWPAEVQTWLVCGLMTLSLGAVAFHGILHKKCPKGVLPGRSNFLAILLTTPVLVFLIIALMAIPLSEVNAGFSGRVFVGGGILITGFILHKLLLAKTDLAYTQVLKYLMWAYLPLPLTIWAITAIWPQASSLIG